MSGGRGWAIGDSVRRWVLSPLTGFLKKTFPFACLSSFVSPGVGITFARDEHVG